MSGPLVAVTVSLLVGVAGCASSPRPAARSQADVLEGAPARTSLPDDPELLRSTWLESAERPDTLGRAIGVSYEGDAPPAVRRLPPVEDDRLETGPLEAGEATLDDWPTRRRSLRPFLRDVRADYRNYYSTESLGLVAIGLGLASITANTGFDATLEHEYQERIRGAGTDEWSEAFHEPKVLGDGYIFLPAFAAAAVAGSWFDERPLGRGLGAWGDRSLRTVVVGAPPMLAVQLITGGSRPGEIDDASYWRPFEDDNGASGHAFMGAIPFLSAAKMTDAPFWKAAFYAGSTLAGLSRVNDHRHYPSQAALGWWMAYVAATAVDRTEQHDQKLTLLPVPVDDGIGLGIEYRQ